MDNTLLDNDRIEADLRAHLLEQFGEKPQRRYWQLFEDIRAELGYADYLGALQRFRLAYPHDGHPRQSERGLSDLDTQIHRRSHPLNQYH